MATSTDTKTNLVINRMSRETFDELGDLNQINDNELYLVDGEDYDMFGKKVVNVADPTNDQDAATKKYVDDHVPTQMSELNNNAGYLTQNALIGYLNATDVSPIQTTGVQIATIGGKTIFAPEGGGGGGGGVALSPCVVMLHDSMYSTSITVGGITIVGSGNVGYFSINSSETARMYGCLIVYVPTDDTYANTIQHVYSGSCLKYDTLISMADGSAKLIKDIKAGDKILCLNPKTNELDEDEVIVAETSEDRVADEYTIWTFDDGTEVSTINRHRFYNNELNEFMYMEAWKNGETAVDANLKGRRLVSSRIVNEKIHHCTLFTKRFNNYFANGLLSGNRNSVDFTKEILP